ncbi:MAG: carbohydrate ABC transporter permease [Carnobacterium sp.]|uniref:carbohydrate ABC transporter permease n=1 Tax=Carnobacterium sp. TaxID=48221 RepID=UPI002FC79F47
MKSKSKRKSKQIWIHVILIVGSILMILPFIWMFLTSGKTISESVQVPPTIFFENFQWENYTNVWGALPFIKFFLNTFLMIAGRVVGSVLFSAMAAFAVAKLDFPGKNLFFGLVLTQMMIPAQIFITPQYLMVQRLGLLNTVTALVLPGIVSAFGTFLLRQFFMGLPDELGEAAVIDGASVWQTFSRIYLPLARSGMIALSIFTALFAFKDLMWPLIVNMSLEKMPLSSGLASLQGQFTTNYPELMAGSVIAMLPMLILYAFFQKQFIEGIATTGGK